ncbi:MAG: hypothetical protein ABSF34_21765, partial [Verrucomicrobiota bacterium]
MNLTIAKDQILLGLQAVQNVVGSRTTLPILSNVLIRAESSTIEFTATDLDVTAACKVEAKVAKPGATTVPVKKEFFRFSMRQFLFALIGLVVTYPFITDLNNGDLIENILMMALLISAVVAVGGRRRLLTILLVIPALAGPWLDRYWHGLVPAWLITGTHMVFAGFVISQLIRFILRETHVNAEVLCAGISAYVMLAVFFTPAYLMVSQLNPASFSGAHLAANQSLTRFDALYFSFVSLTCLGCNDI